MRHGRASEPSSRVFQDWRAWMEEGLVDLVRADDLSARAHRVGRRRLPAWLAWTRAPSLRAPCRNGHRRVPELDRGHVACRRGEALGATTSRRRARCRCAAPRAAWSSSRWARTTPRSPRTRCRSRSATRPIARSRISPPGLTTGARARDSRSRQATLSPLFAASVPVPVMPWKAAPTTGHLKGVVTGAGGAPVDGADDHDRSAPGANNSRRAHRRRRLLRPRRSVARRVPRPDRARRRRASTAAPAPSRSSPARRHRRPPHRPRHAGHGELPITVNGEQGIGNKRTRNKERGTRKGLATDVSRYCYLLLVTCYCYLLLVTCYRPVPCTSLFRRSLFACSLFRAVHSHAAPRTPLESPWTAPRQPGVDAIREHPASPRRAARRRRARGCWTCRRRAR